MVAAAYLIAGPGTSSDRTAQAQPYLAALIAVGAGLIASVLIAMPGRRVPLPPRKDLNLDELQPLSGDVVRRPGGRGLPERPTFGQEFTGRGGAESYPGALAEPWPGEPYAATLPATERQSSRQSDRQPDRHSTSGSGWDSDTWPGTRAGRLAGRHGDAHEGEHEPGSGSGSTYHGGTYGSAPENRNVTGTMPMMGQPTDPHESWLHDLGPGGRHGFDDDRS
jgi:hypothetical protein